MSAPVAPPVIVTAVTTAAVLLGLVVWAAIRTRSMTSPFGVVGTARGVPAGTTGIVRAPLEPVGSIYVAGEEWSARAADGGRVERGAPVRVVSTDGLTLTGEPEASSSIGS